MDTDIYRKFDKYCLLLQSYLSIAAILLLTFGIDAILFSSIVLADPTAIYYLNKSQESYRNDHWSTSNYWFNTDDSEGSITPGEVNNSFFVVGGGKWLRVPFHNGGNDPETFPYKSGGAINSLYLGYKLENGSLVPDTGFLNIKSAMTTIDNLVIGNGTVYQGNENLVETIQGAITINGNGTLKINNSSSTEKRALIINSAISGTGTLNFVTNVKISVQTTGVFAEDKGFLLDPVESSGFSGNVVIDNKSRVALNAENIFINASSVTSGGELNINANQKFNVPLNCTDGLFRFNVTVVQEGNSYVMKSGNLVLESGGRINNLIYRVTESKYTGEPYNISSDVVKQFIKDNGNITNNGSQDLILNNSSNTEYAGVINSNGKLIKTGDKTLTLTSKENQSINCNVEINEGTILLDNQISGFDRFGEGKTVTINEGGTLACKAQDSFGNGGANVTININGGTLQLNSKNNQTFMNKTVEMTGGEIKSTAADCKGIEMKTGTSIHVNASSTPSTISVPIKVRENHLLEIDVDDNARLEFTSAIYKANSTTKGIDKKGAGVVVFSGSFYDPVTSANTYTAKITVTEGVVQLRDEALTTYGQIEVKSTGDLELFVDGDVPKTMTVATANKIFGPGDIKKTGDGTLKLFTEAEGLVSAESLVVSSGRLDLQGYMGGKISVDSGAVFSPGDSIGEATFGGGFILNEAGAELLMEIGGADISLNDAVIASGDLTLHDGSIVYLAATDDCDLQPGDTFTAVLSGNNSADIQGNFISKYVRATHFTDLQYIQLEGGEHAGKYAITGRYYIDTNSVPEPSTWALLILGVAGLLYLRTRKT